VTLNKVVIVLTACFVLERLTLVPFIAGSRVEAGKDDQNLEALEERRELENKSAHRAHQADSLFLAFLATSALV
jgi:hypothetical protein